MKVCFKQCVVAFGVLCINAPFMHGVIVELRRCVHLAQFSCDFTITSTIDSHNLFFNTLQNVDIVIIHYSNNYICNG